MNHKNEDIEELSDEMFDGYISQNRVVLVDFWAPWCMPCNLQGRMLRSKIKDLPEGAKLVKINVDKNPMTSRRFHVRGIPQLHLFVDGKIKNGWTGVTPVEVLFKEMKRFV